jgi:hypothetical protein
MRDYLILLLVTVGIAWMDGPGRFAAERNGASLATIKEYENKGSWRRPWIAIAETADGTRLKNDDRWTFRWYPVGTEIEWIARDKVYFGGFFFRWMIYLSCVALFLFMLSKDLIQKLRQK